MQFTEHAKYFSFTEPFILHMNLHSSDSLIRFWILDSHQLFANFTEIVFKYWETWKEIIHAFVLLLLVIELYLMSKLNRNGQILLVHSFSFGRMVWFNVV